VSQLNLAELKDKYSINGIESVIIFSFFFVPNTSRAKFLGEWVANHNIVISLAIAKIFGKDHRASCSAAETIKASQYEI
jgi:hypothetical protein